MAPSSTGVIATTFALSRSGRVKPEKPRRLSMEGLQRAMSNLSFELSKGGEAAAAADIITSSSKLASISEVFDANCECCGMSEECTSEYISRVRDKFGGRWICGLCSEAVKGELEKNGGIEEAALDTHMSACKKFNRIGRTHPLLYQAEAMTQILRKCSRSASISPKERVVSCKSKGGGIARSSSCIPAITEDIHDEMMYR